MTLHFAVKCIVKSRYGSMDVLDIWVDQLCRMWHIWIELNSSIGSGIITAYVPGASIDCTQIAATGLRNIINETLAGLTVEWKNKMYSPSVSVLWRFGKSKSFPLWTITCLTRDLWINIELQCATWVPSLKRSLSNSHGETTQTGSAKIFFGRRGELETQFKNEIKCAV